MRAERNDPLDTADPSCVRAFRVTAATRLPAVGSLRGRAASCTRPQPHGRGTAPCPLNWLKPRVSTVVVRQLKYWQPCRSAANLRPRGPLLTPRFPSPRALTPTPLATPPHLHRAICSSTVSARRSPPWTMSPAESTTLRPGCCWWACCWCCCCGGSRPDDDLPLPRDPPTLEPSPGPNLEVSAPSSSPPFDNARGGTVPRRAPHPAPRVNAETGAASRLGAGPHPHSDPSPTAEAVLDPRSVLL